MENRIYMLPEWGERQKMGFVLTTEAGGVILIDGGYSFEAVRVLRRLREITGQAAPHLDAVILTHPHSDHIGAFNVLMERHAAEFTADAVYCNFPSAAFIRRNGEPQEAVFADAFFRLMPKFADKLHIVSGGDSVTVKGAEVRFLYSPDCELTANVGNNASLVFTVTAAGKRVLFTGDCGVEAGEKLIRMYGRELKADICQMSHHGQNGVSRAFYELVRPDVCLWCAPKWLWDNDIGKGFDTHTFRTVAVRRWMDEISPGHTDYVTMNGEQRIDL